LKVNGQEINFDDANTFYRVSTVNYLAAGSCNFNNNGVSLWPLNQIANDTQYYVRDAVIDYTTAMGTVSPAIEGRLSFIADTTAPVITINAPTASVYPHPASLTFDFSATDDSAGVKQVVGLLDGSPVTSGQVLDLYILALGDHTFTVNATDKAGNSSTQSLTFSITATVDSLKTAVDRFYQDGSIKNKETYKKLMKELADASKSTEPEDISEALREFIHEVKDHSRRHITAQAADLLILDANWVIVHLPDTTAPYVKIQSPRAASYFRDQSMKIEFYACDKITGVQAVTALLDGVSVTHGQRIDLYAMALGEHTLTVAATDYAGNVTTRSVTFKLVANVHSLKSGVDYFYKSGKIDSRALRNELMTMLEKAERSHKTSDTIKALNAFIAKLQQQSGSHIQPDAANLLIADAQWVVAHLK
jgi:hypothetical protein